MAKRLLDVLWLVALSIFVFALPPTFHGDEPMQISMSRDYVTAFVDHNPAALLTESPYYIDTDPYLRLINGSINRYAIGLSWQIAGFTAADLPTAPGWTWELDYTTNADLGHLPTSAQLAAARLPSTLLLALSVVVMFMLGWHFGGRLAAYFVSGLYALNPIILLNGRRALQEGSMLFFGTLVILIAALISQQSGSSRRGGTEFRPYIMPILWLLLILAGALTLASKHSGIVFVAGALGWVFVAELTRLRSRTLLWTTVKLIAAAVLVVALFIGLSPALWNNPRERARDLLDARTQLIDFQVAADPLAPMTLAQRIEGIITQPFLTPLQHYEVAFWGTFPAITADIDRYMASPFSGIQFGAVLGGALTLLEGLGVIVALRGLRAQPEHCAGLLTWLLVIVASLLANPLDWQRYYLPLIPVSTLLVLLGLRALLTRARRFVLKSEQPPQLSPTLPQTD